MPRYGEEDYDPDFDDSPPPSPKRKALLQARSPSLLRAIILRIRRSRGFLTALLIFSSLIYFFTHLGPIFKPKHQPSLQYKNVNWKLYAYSQYATDSDHLCNAVMIFEALHRYGSRADRVLMYPQSMDTMVSDVRDRDSQLLVKARDMYGVKLIPVEIPHIVRNTASPNPAPFTDPSTASWDESITKLIAFNLTQYIRILHLDNDLTLKAHLDSLFLLPSAPVAMTRAYWSTTTTPPSSAQSQNTSLPPLPQPQLSPHLILLEPSETEATRLLTAKYNLIHSPLYTSSPSTPIDSLILNHLYSSSALLLPHKLYGLRTSEFRITNPNPPSPSSPLHAPFLGYDPSTYPLDPSSSSSLSLPNPAHWSPHRILREASLIHFSGDDPLPKPWVLWPQNLLAEIQPKCQSERIVETEGKWGGTVVRKVEEGCEDREVWLGLYDDFRRRRKGVCGLLGVPAPIWNPGGGGKVGKMGMGKDKAEEEGKARMEGKGEGREKEIGKVL